MPAPNRIAVYATIILSLLVAVLPLVAEIDWKSTAGILAGLGTIALVVLKWLDGWQNMEKAQYQDQLDRNRSAIMQETEAAAIRAANEQGSAARKPTINLPR